MLVEKIHRLVLVFALFCGAIGATNSYKSIILNASSEKEALNQLKAIKKGKNSASEGEEVLLWASRRGYADVVTYLLKNGVDINAEDPFGTPGFMWAAVHQHTRVLDAFLEVKDKEGIPIIFKKKVEKKVFYDGHRLFFWSIKMGAFEAVEKLLPFTRSKKKMAPIISLTAEDLLDRTPFIQAAQKKNEKIMILLLAQRGKDGIPLIFKEKGGDALFASVVQNGYAEAFDLLLPFTRANGGKKPLISIDPKKGKGNILIYAIQNGQVDFLEKVMNFLEKRKLLDDALKEKDLRGKTPLIHAIAHDNNKIFSKLIEVLEKRKLLDDALKEKDLRGKTPLIHAIAHDNNKIFSKLIEVLEKRKLLDDALKEKNRMGEMPLIHAIAHDKSEVFSKLIDILEKRKLLDDALKEKDLMGETPLFHAIAHDKSEVFSKLIEVLQKRKLLDDALKEKDANNKNSIFLYMIKYNKIDQVKKLLKMLEKREDFLVELLQEKNGYFAPFMWAATHEHVGMMDALLSLRNKEGIPLLLVKTKNNDKNDTLFACIEYDKVKAFEKLMALKKKDKKSLFSLEERDKEGNTPLMKAMFLRNKNMAEKIIEMLKERKQLADALNAKNNRGHTPLIKAVLSGNLSLVNLLIKQKGIDLNLADKDGYTPLIYAVSFISSTRKKESKDIVKALLSLKKADGTPRVDLFKRSSSGDDALALAKAEEHRKPLVPILEKALNESGENTLLHRIYRSFHYNRGLATLLFFFSLSFFVMLFSLPSQKDAKKSKELEDLEEELEKSGNV